MHDLIRLQGICKTYRTKEEKLYVLDNIDIRIKDGEFISITGQSGSGKSTLMNILGCLDRADSGRYYFDGISVEKMNDRKMCHMRNKSIGFVFQSFNLIPSMNSLENVMLPLMYRGVSREKREQLAKEALCKVGLENRMSHYPVEMSGGQQQRTAIARAIAMSPKVLLADEPTGSLDKSSGEEVLSIMKEMNNKGVTVVMITHDEKIAAAAGRQIRISDGKIVDYC